MPVTYVLDKAIVRASCNLMDCAFVESFVTNTNTLFVPSASRMSVASSAKIEQGQGNLSYVC
jgi:hypothetical protein